MKYNMINFLSRTITVCFFAVCSLSVYADDGLTCGSLSLERGQSGYLEIYYVGENANYSGLTFTLTLPTGVSASVNPDDEEHLIIESTITKGDVNACTIIASFNAEKGTCQFSIDANSTTGKLFKQKKGLLLSLQVKAAEDVSGLVDVSIRVRSMSAGEENVETGIDKNKNTFKAAVGGFPVAFNSDGYATVCSAKALDFSDSGVTGVYTVSAVADNTATLSLIESKKVPANAGVIVEGSGTVFVPFAEGTVDALGTNKLIGVTEATAIAEGNFVLQGDRFVRCNAGTLPGGKAYLEAGASEAKGIAFDFGGTTGINEVQKAETDGAIYNLSGMRVSKIQKGVYIMNGRKVIVK